MSLEDTTYLQGGIPLAAGFYYRSEAPLDKRFVVKTQEGLTELVSANAAYNGLQVYVENAQDTYRFVNGKWEKVLEEEDIEKLIAQNAVNAMEFMGTINALPTDLTAADKGHFYKVVNDIYPQNYTIEGPIESGEYFVGNGAPLKGKIYLGYTTYEGYPDQITITVGYKDETGEYPSVSESYEFTQEKIYDGSSLDYDLSNRGIYDINYVNVTIIGNHYGTFSYICLTEVAPIDTFVIKKNDSVVWGGSVWYVIPGDTDTDTWRPIKINDTPIENKELNLKQGSNITFSNLDGAVTISAKDTTYTADEQTLELTNTEFSVKNGGIITDKLADNAVTETKINDKAVTTNKIADTAVTNAKLADNAVQSGKIADGAVTERKLDSNLKNAINAVSDKLNANGWTDNKNGGDGWKYEDGSGKTAEITPESISSAYEYDGYSINSSGFSFKNTDNGEGVQVLTKVTRTGISQITDIQTTQYNYPDQGGTLVVKENLHKIATTGSLYDNSNGATHISKGTGDAGTRYILFNCGTSTTVISDLT